MALGLMACGPAQASSASANLAVSVTVIDLCLIRAESRSASCAGGAAYALGVGRERIAVTSDQLTVADEHAHTAEDGSRLGISRSVAGAAGQRGMAPADGAVRTVAATTAPIDAIRVTYSF
jgi:hypothetical protein